VRRTLLALSAAACATAPPAAGPEALCGCWIERRGEQTVTQRWFPRRGGWQGDELTYFQSGAEPEAVRWRLRPDGADGWLMCMVELTMASGPPCWRAVFGPGVSEGEGDRWVEIETAPETLRIVYVSAGDRMVTYDGRRDGCD